MCTLYIVSNFCRAARLFSPLDPHVPSVATASLRSVAPLCACLSISSARVARRAPHRHGTTPAQAEEAHEESLGICRTMQTAKLIEERQFKMTQ